MVDYSLPEDRIEAILAVSGGADSVYLLNLSRQKIRTLLVAHYNHGARGKESEEDQRFLENLCKDWGFSMEVGRAQPEATEFPITGRKDKLTPRFEEKARETRYAFLKDLLAQHKAKKILVAHTADDQVETVLMRVLEGAGITGLKGIPRVTEEGIERPLLDTWREDILEYLKKHKIPYRIDKSNLDTRLERNWIRHALIPLLEKRYGKSVKKRIFALGERFRELDIFIDKTAYNWLKKNNIYNGKIRKSNRPRSVGPQNGGIRIPRKTYVALPSIVRIRILQIFCFEHVGTSPNERLLGSMDRVIVSGSPSARLNIGKGATLRCRYGEAIFSTPGEKATSGVGEVRRRRSGKGRERKDRREERGEEKEKRGRARNKNGASEPVSYMDGPGIYRWNHPLREDAGVRTGSALSVSWEERGKTAPMHLRRMARGERKAAFDAELLRLPLSVRPLRAGDRVQPFGLKEEKKVKEILIDRKVPRGERWERPVVCDAGGRIVWIPGVLRSADAVVTSKTRHTIVLRADIG